MKKEQEKTTSKKQKVQVSKREQEKARKLKAWRNKLRDELNLPGASDEDIDNLARIPRRVVVKRIINGKIYTKVGSTKDPEVAKNRANELKAKKVKVKILKGTKMDEKGKEHIVYTLYKLMKGQTPPGREDYKVPESTHPYIRAAKHPLYKKFQEAEKLMAPVPEKSERMKRNRMALHDKAVEAMAENSKDAAKHVESYIKYVKRHKWIY